MCRYMAKKPNQSFVLHLRVRLWVRSWVCVKIQRLCIGEWTARDIVYHNFITSFYPNVCIIKIKLYTLAPKPSLEPHKHLAESFIRRTNEKTHNSASKFCNFCFFRFQLLPFVLCMLHQHPWISVLFIYIVLSDYR